MTRIFSTADGLAEEVARTAKPAVWLFSGWNCAPKMWPERDRRHEAAAIAVSLPATSRAVAPERRDSCARSRSRFRRSIAVEQRRRRSRNRPRSSRHAGYARSARGVEPRHRPAIESSPGAGRWPRFDAVGAMQLHAEADAEERRTLRHQLTRVCDAIGQPESQAAPSPAGNAPTPGRTIRSASTQVLPDRACDDHVRRTALFKRARDRVEVAEPVSITTTVRLMTPCARSVISCRS